MIGVSTDAGAVRLQGLHEGREAGDLGGVGHAAPIVQTSGHGGPSGVGLPQALQLLLERVERGQWLILDSS